MREIPDMARRQNRILGGFSVLMALLVTVIAFTGPAQARYASIVIDTETGRVLHETNADTRNYPASLTKIMTLYMAFDALDSGKWTLNTKLKVSRRAEGMAPSKLGLKRGQTLSVKDAILALVTKSANDAAVVVAEGLGGTESKFARIMTNRARALGMKRTTFRNASGLPNRRQLSTARDMSILGVRIREDFPHYYEYFSRTHFKYGKRTYKNHNNLLTSYEGTDGIKTGYIRASGFNLVASVQRDEGRLIGVVFGGRTAKSRDRHLKKLLDKGFKKLAAINARKHLVVAEADKPRRVDGKVTGTPFENEEAQGDAADAVAGLPPKGDWVIQVGAFSSRDRALGAAQAAVSKLGDLSDGTNILVSPTKKKKYFRARLQGLDKRGAYNACRVLKKARIDCMEIQPRASS